MPLPRFIFGRMRSQAGAPQARLSGYNAQMQRNALAVRPMAAQVQQDARQSQPLFSVPPPDAPARDPGPAPAGLKVDPAIAEELAKPVPGADFANEVLQRHVPQTSPGIDTGLAVDAGPDTPLKAGINTLGEEPLPASPGERAGTAMRAAVNAANINPQSPDIAHILPALGQIGLASEKDALGPPESPAQQAERLARAGGVAAAGRLNDARAKEVAPNATARRGMEDAAAGEHKARAAEIAPNAQSQRGVNDERVKSMHAKAIHDDLMARVAAGKMKLSEAALTYKMAIDQLKGAQAEEKPGIISRLIRGAPDERAQHIAQANEAVARARGHSMTAPAEEPPPSGGSDQQGEPTPEVAYKVLEDPASDEMDRQGAQLFLRAHGLPEKRVVAAK